MEFEDGKTQSDARPPGELVAANHFIMIRAHVEELQIALQRFSRLPFSAHAVARLRHAFIDVRMIIEELMLLSVAAHKDAGEAISRSLRKGYKADQRMEQLRAINPRFFPVAIDVIPSDEPGIDGKFIDIDGGYMTEDDIRYFYFKSGDNLHASSKYINESQYKENINSIRNFTNLISKLLKTFEIDISGQEYTMLGHLNLGTKKPPELFSAEITHRDDIKIQKEI